MGGSVHNLPLHVISPVLPQALSPMYPRTYKSCCEWQAVNIVAILGLDWHTIKMPTKEKLERRLNKWVVLCSWEPSQTWNRVAVQNSTFCAFLVMVVLRDSVSMPCEIGTIIITFSIFVSLTYSHVYKMLRTGSSIEGHWLLPNGYFQLILLHKLLWGRNVA